MCGSGGPDHVEPRSARRIPGGPYGAVSCNTWVAGGRLRRAAVAAAHAQHRTQEAAMSASYPRGGSEWEPGTPEPELGALEEAARAWWLGLVVGLLSVAGGVVLIVWTKPTLTVVAVLVGIELLIGGIFLIIAAFGRPAGSRSGAVLAGAVAVIAGLIVVRHPSGSVLVDRARGRHLPDSRRRPASRRRGRGEPRPRLAPAGRPVRPGARHRDRRLAEIRDHHARDRAGHSPDRARPRARIDRVRAARRRARAGAVARPAEGAR